MTRRIRIGLATLAVLAVGCTATQADDSDTGSEAEADTGGHCRTNEDCDDSIACTVDSCAVGGVCTHQTVNEMCADGETCVVGRGCVVGACMSDPDCDDTLACTVDVCGVGGVCSHQAIDARCAALERCDLVEGCIASGECASAADCNDDVACTVDDCLVGNVCDHAPNDALCPADQVCDPASGCFLQVPCTTPDECPVDNFCDGIPRCDPEFGCRPPTAVRDCDDRDACTVDSCDRDAEMCAYDVNCDLSECVGGHPECLWNGCFDVVPAISQRCGMGSVNINISRLCFELRGPSLYAVPSPAVSLSDGGAMEMVQAPAPAGTAFDVSDEVSGGCIETYRIAGAFHDEAGTLDRNTIDATWTSTYVDFDGISCALGRCANQTVGLTLTRVP
jgi:hypothetical protein